MIDIECAKDIMREYIDGYDSNNPRIALKKAHIFRVTDFAEQIAINLKNNPQDAGMELTDEDVRLATLIGLLHDIGRFEQLKRFDSFIDSQTVDHAKLGIEVLTDNNNELLRKFCPDEKYHEIILTAIGNHNKFKIDNSITEIRMLTHCKIIRDADKLDILYAFSNPRILELNEDDSELSSEVIIEFKKHKQIRNEYVKTVNDKILVFLAFAFDLNYDYSKQTILEKGYYDKMFEHIKNKDKFKPYFDEVKKYLKGE